MLAEAFEHTETHLHSHQAPDAGDADMLMNTLHQANMENHDTAFQFVQEHWHATMKWT